MAGEGQLRDWLDGLAALGGAASAVEAIVAEGQRLLFRHGSGYRVGGEPLVAASGARFDAASLTKPWMATLALVLDAAERAAPGSGLSLGERIPTSDSGARDAPLPRMEDLLRHRAGLPAWAPLGARLGRRLGDPVALRDFLLEERRAAAGDGAHGATAGGRTGGRSGERPSSLYSDLGYLLWGLLVEERQGRSLATLLDELVCAPLGVAPLGGLAAGDEIADAVECRLDNGREVELAAALGTQLGRSRSFHRGVPQDGNARALRAAGIPPAHAGLFVTADEMLALAREWLRPRRLLSAEQVRAALADGGGYALGWARWSAEGAAGPALSPASFGHNGFTGGSLWIDPERGRIFLLLAHRLSSAVDFQPFRREFHRLAVALD